jgi:ferritin
MIKDEMATALNEQINKEMYSAYLYMSMSNQCANLGLKGFSTWFMAQYHEEMFHAMKFYEYVQRQGAEVDLQSIAAPPAEFSSPLDMFEKTLAHEQFVTQSINELMELAISHKDHATQIFLEWFVTEQVEEEETDNDILAQLRLVGENPHGLLMMDRELGGRGVTVPVDYTAGLSGSE